MVAQARDAVPGPAPSDSEETRMRVELLPPERDDFPLEQSRDETLNNAYDRVRTIDGQLLQPDQLLSYPYFSIIKERLYRVTQDAQTRENSTQLLVAKKPPGNAFPGRITVIPWQPTWGNVSLPDNFGQLFMVWRHVRECSLVNPPGHYKSAIVCQLALVEVPFQRIGMDLIEPLERSARGHRVAFFSNVLCNTISGSSAVEHHFGKE